MSSLSPPLNEGIGADTTLRGCSELEEWITLEILLTKNSDYHIVGNKLQSFLTDESHHSKWEEFRRMARADTANEECSQLLRRLELQDSDEDEDDMTEVLTDKGAVEIVKVLLR